MKMKKTKKSAIVAGALAAVLAVSGAFAYLSDADSATNKFQFLDDDGEQTIDIDLVEPGWDEAVATDENGDFIATEDDKDADGIPDFAENVIYGAPVEKAPHVENLGENDVYTFVKVLVPTKNVITSGTDGVWESAASKALFKLLDTEGTDLVEAKGNDSWTLIKTETNASYDANTQAVTPATYTAYVFAHKTVVGAHETTVPVFDKVEMINLVNGQIDADDPNTPENEATNINIYVDAYAIQADGQESTDLSELWNVVMNDDNGINGVATFDYFAALK